MPLDCMKSISQRSENHHRSLYSMPIATAIFFLISSFSLAATLHARSVKGEQHATASRTTDIDATITLISADLGLFDIEIRSADPSFLPSRLRARAEGGDAWTEVALHPSDARIGPTRSNGDERVGVAARVYLPADGVAREQNAGKPSSLDALDASKHNLQIEFVPIWDFQRVPAALRFPESKVIAQTPESIVVEAALPAAQLAPAWAMGATWYQVFPERFRNANPGNDPDRTDTALRSWTSDWSQTSVHELEQAWAAQHADPRTMQLSRWASNGVGTSLVFRRRYGGDLQGVVERLDYLETLGIDAIYLCPVFDAQSLHKYEAADHRHVDPTMGDPGSPVRPSTPRQPMPHDASETVDPSTWTWTAADHYLIDTLLPEAHARGMRVMLDGVWNHVGLANWAFADVVERGTASAYADWFECRFDSEGQLIGWEGWANTNGALPEFRHTEDGDLNPGIKQFVFDVTRRWMDPDGDGDPSDGIDGWRLDVASEIGRTFWRDWRAHVRSINPDALIIGEIWFPGGDYFDGTAWDGQMNYPFAYPMTDWLALDPSFTAGELGDVLTQAHRNAPHTELVQMNLLVSHDTERLGSLLMNPGRDYEQGANIRDPNSTYNPARPDDRARAQSVLAAAIQATWVGSPMIYHGDELGMPGADDPDNRRPLWWPDLDKPAVSDAIWDPATFLGYRTWLKHRYNSDFGHVLRYGDAHVLPSPSDDVFAYARTLNTTEIRVFANRSDRPIRIEPIGGTGRVVFGPNEPVIPGNSAVFWVIEHHRVSE